MGAITGAAYGSSIRMCMNSLALKLCTLIADSRRIPAFRKYVLCSKIITNDSRLRRCIISLLLFLKNFFITISCKIIKNNFLFLNYRRKDYLLVHGSIIASLLQLWLLYGCVVSLML